MKIFDQFFTKFSYKFDKGYPDMDNPTDVSLLESLISKNNMFIGHNFLGKYLDCGTLNGYINASKEISKI